MNKLMIIAVDFDGTICYEDKGYPEIGTEIPGAIETLKDCKTIGHKIILFTCREGDPLKMAIEYCKSKGLEFDSVNSNCIQTNGFAERKPYWDVLIDDRNFSPYHRNMTQEIWGMFRHYLVDGFKKEDSSNG